MRRLCAILAILCPACGLFAAYDMRNQPTAALDGWKIEAEAARPDAVCRSVEDEDLIALTGGVCQGMSGSPIVQNGKLIGAVTHVLVDDPTEGYAVFIENMIK